MKQKLFANFTGFIKTFCICIAGITLLVLAARLTFFKEMATAQRNSAANSNIVQGSSDWFAYKFNSKVYFSKPSSKGDVLMENPSSNTCLMSVTILDPATKDTYLYTGFMEPGTFIDTAKLEVELPVGKHDCILKIVAYSPDPPNDPLGSIDETVTLYVGQKPEQ